MKNKNLSLLLLVITFFTSTYCFASLPTAKTAIIAPLSTLLPIPDSVIVDTISFRDMNDEYTILLYKVDGNIVQMDIDRLGSSTLIDYIIWDMDKNGRLEAIAVYNVLDQKKEYHLIEEDFEGDDILEYQIQIEDIGFPSFFDSSEIPKAVYKSEEHQPVLNYYK